MQHVPVSVDPQHSICAGDSVQLGAEGGIAWRWYDADTILFSTSKRPMVYPAVTTTYTILITENRCFSDTLTQLVTVFPLPTINLGPDLEASAGSSIKLHAATTFATSIAWTPFNDLSCSDCNDPVAKVRRAITYVVIVKNPLGCAAIDTINIALGCDEHYFFLPNTFTPNADGQNDFFYPHAAGLSIIKKFTIYSRWGEVVFSASNFSPNDRSAGWNGTYKNIPLAPDVFVYTLDGTCENGSTKSVGGSVALIR
jgi:gliding motility-associated-like protein